jgi:hypothetical protein
MVVVESCVIILPMIRLAAFFSAAVGGVTEGVSKICPTVSSYGEELMVSVLQLLSRCFR